jgi:nucleoside-triphosphatase THEP1
MQKDILPIINESNRNLFILGKAGVGKSTLIKVVKKNLGVKCIILSPTGIAAQNVNGLTIHSFFGLPLKDLFTDKELSICASKIVKGEKYLRVSEVESLIIDEISMVNSQVFDAIDFILRSVMQNNEPFGGKRLILIGDIFQLPPVDRTNSKGDKIFFWKSNAFQRTEFLRLELKKVYRLNEVEENQKFEYILGNIRLYKANQLDLNFLNDRTENSQNLIESTVLCSTRLRVSEYNSFGLDALKKPIVTFRAEVSSNFPKNEYPMDTELRIAIGAPVLFIRNDSAGNYKNGTRGIIEEIDEDNKKLLINLSNGVKISIGYSEWIPTKFNDSIRININSNVGYFRHFPIVLGFAMTIHRCQGMTLDNIHLDLGKGAFSPGQLYVGLSRLKKLSGLSLARPLYTKDIIESQETARFYQEANFEEVNLNLSGAEINSIDLEKEIIKTTSGNFLQTKELSVKLFKEGLSIHEISEERIRLGLKEIQTQTIIGHLVENFNELDQQELQAILNISEAMEATVISELNKIEAIKELTLGEIKGIISDTDISWNQLKYILYINKVIDPPKPTKEKEANPVIQIKKPKSLQEIDVTLFEKLRELRNHIAKERNIPVYLVFNNETLEEISKQKPMSNRELLKIKGVGESKLIEFGFEFLSEVQKYSS